MIERRRVGDADHGAARAPAIFGEQRRGGPGEVRRGLSLEEDERAVATYGEGGATLLQMRLQPAEVGVRWRERGCGWPLRDEDILRRELAEHITHAARKERDRIDDAHPRVGNPRAGAQQGMHRGPAIGLAGGQERDVRLYLGGADGLDPGERLEAPCPVGDRLAVPAGEHELVTPAQQRPRRAERVLAEGLRVEQRLAMRARDDLEPARVAGHAHRRRRLVRSQAQAQLEIAQESCQSSDERTDPGLALREIFELGDMRPVERETEEDFKRHGRRHRSSNRRGLQGFRI